MSHHGQHLPSPVFGENLTSSQDARVVVGTGASGAVSYASTVSFPSSSGKVTWIIDIGPLATPPVDEMEPQHKAIQDCHKTLRKTFQDLLNASRSKKCYTFSIIGQHFPTARPKSISYGGGAHIQALCSSLLEKAFDLYADLCKNFTEISEIHIISRGSGSFLALRITQLIDAYDRSIWEHASPFEEFEMAWTKLLENGDILADSVSRDERKGLSELIRTIVLIEPSLRVPRRGFHIRWSAPVFYRLSGIEPLPVKSAIYHIKVSQKGPTQTLDVPVTYKGLHLLSSPEIAIKRFASSIKTKNYSAEIVSPKMGPLLGPNDESEMRQSSRVSPHQIWFPHTPGIFEELRGTGDHLMSDEQSEHVAMEVPRDLRMDDQHGDRAESTERSHVSNVFHSSAAGVWQNTGSKRQFRTSAARTESDAWASSSSTGVTWPRKDTDQWGRQVSNSFPSPNSTAQENDKDSISTNTNLALRRIVHGSGLSGAVKIKRPKWARHEEEDKPTAQEEDKCSITTNAGLPLQRKVHGLDLSNSAVKIPKSDRPEDEDKPIAQEVDGFSITTKAGLPLQRKVRELDLSGSVVKI